MLQHASTLLLQFDARHICNTLEDPFSRGLSDWSLCPMGPHPTVKSTALLGRVDAWHRQRGSLGFGGDRERRTEKLIEKQMMRIDRFRPLSSRASVFSEMVLMEFVLCCQQSTVPVEVGD